MIKSPSKHISLARLKEILKNHCIGETGQEYDQYELQQRIIELSSTKAQAETIEYPSYAPTGHVTYFPPLMTKARGFKFNHDLNRDPQKQYIFKIVC